MAKEDAKLFGKNSDQLNLTFFQDVKLNLRGIHIKAVKCIGLGCKRMLVEKTEMPLRCTRDGYMGNLKNEY